MALGIVLGHIDIRATDEQCGSDRVRGLDTERAEVRVVGLGWTCHGLPVAGSIPAQMRRPSPLASFSAA
jgi:hypothetical protein